MSGFDETDQLAEFVAWRRAALGLGLVRVGMILAFTFACVLLCCLFGAVVVPSTAPPIIAFILMTVILFIGPTLVISGMMLASQAPTDRAGKSYGHTAVILAIVLYLMFAVLVAILVLGPHYEWLIFVRHLLIDPLPWSILSVMLGMTSIFLVHCWQLCLREIATNVGDHVLAVDFNAFRSGFTLFASVLFLCMAVAWLEKLNQAALGLGGFILILVFPIFYLSQVTMIGQAQKRVREKIAQFGRQEEPREIWEEEL